MATITLTRPVSGRTNITVSVNNNIEFLFPTREAVFIRDGDNLILTFHDGSQIELTDFYKVYTRENIPDFIVEGKEIKGEDFFAALENPDLMPAAGPDTNEQDSNRFHEYDDASLMDGINHLDGLDFRTERAFLGENGRPVMAVAKTESENTAYRNLSMSDAPDLTPSSPFEPDSPLPEPIKPTPVDPSRPAESTPQPMPSPVEPENPPVKPAPEPPVNPVPDMPVNPQPDPIVPDTPRPEPEPVVPDPVVPEPENPAPTEPVPETPIQAKPVPATPEVPNITVREDGIASGESAPVTVPGFEIVEVVKNGGKGTLEKDPDTGEWKYTLKEPSDHPDSGEDILKDGDEVVIKVRDPEGNEFEITQKFDIVDDTPEVGNDHKETVSGDLEGVSGQVTIGFGADNDPEKTEIRIEGKKPGEEIRGDHGVIIINEDGSYTYKADPKGIDDPDTSTDEFTVTVKDADGDEVKGKITIDVKKPEGPAPDSVLVDESLLFDGGAKAGIEIPGYTIVEILANGSRGTLVQEGESWLYTLSEKQDHSATGRDIRENVDSVTLKVRDANGNEYSVIRTINVQDDVPEAAITGGAPVLAGNEISGAITVDWGVDNDASRKLFVTINGEEKEISGKTEFDSQYGKLTVDSDGSWTYAANGMDRDHTSAKENISVRVVDSDGDIASPETWAEAWLRNNPDKTPDDVPPSPYETVIDITKPEGPENPENVKVSEKGLPETSPDVPVTPPAGYEIVEVKTPGDNGTLEKDPETGEWKYVLKTPEEHPESGNDTAKDGDTVVIIVRDPLGNEYEIEQKVDIIDDVPAAGNDHKETTSGDPAGVSGSVTIDFGADNNPEKTAVTISVNGKDYKPGDEIKGEHGVLTITPDGNYTYKSDPKGIDDPAESADEFKIKVKDADGDEAEGKIVIDVKKPEGPDPDSVLVDESLLPDGNAKAGIEIPGYTIVEILTNGSMGTLIQEGESWIYTLSEKQDHTAAGRDIREKVDSVTLKVKDANGNEYSVIRTINVQDDVPEASISSGGAVLSGNEISGAITVDWGVDNTDGKKLFVTINGEETEISGKTEIEGAHGKLTVDTDGSWTYTANGLGKDTASAKENISVRVVDSDGDIASPETWAEAWLKENPDKTPDDVPPSPYETVIDIAKPDGPDPTEVSIAEKGLRNDGHPETIVNIDGYEIVEILKNGEKGVIDETGKYVLDDNADHLPPNGEELPEGDTVRLVVRDSKGNEYVIDQPIKIIDDTPEARIDESEKSTLSGDPSGVSGKVDIEFGADNDDGKKFVVKVNGKDEEFAPGTEIRGDHGVLTIDQGGNYSYVSDPKGIDDPDGKDVFSFEVTDSDGDTASAQLTVNVTKPTINLDPIDSHEAHMATGDAVHSGAYTILGVIGQGQFGNVEETETGWIYKLNDNLDHGEPGSETDKVLSGKDTVTLKVRDANGNEYSVDVPVNVYDDTPDASLDRDAASVVAGKEFSGKLDYDFGADNDDAKKITVEINGQKTELATGADTVVDGQFGVLTVHSDGSYTYKANEGQEGKEIFSFTVTDSDGDIVGVDANGNSTLKVTVDVKNEPPVNPISPVLEDGHLVVNEKDMATDSAKAGITITDKDGKIYTIKEVVEDGFFGKVVQEGGSWVYRLDKAAQHDGEGRDTMVNADMVRLKVADEDGNLYIVNRKIDIIDDIPEMELSNRDLGNVLAGAESAASGKLEYGFGADDREGAKIVVTVDGREIELETGKENVIQGKYGELVITEDGTYKYHANADAVGKDNFNFRIEDADGDVVESDATGKTFDVVVDVHEKKEPENGEVTVNEKDMRGGGIASAELTVDGFEIVGLVSDGVKGHAELVDGKWIYTLDEVVSHPEQGADTAKNVDSVILKVKDMAGNEYEVTKTVNVIDDTPEMAVTGGGSIHAGQSVDGTISLEYGADGAGKTYVSFDGKETQLVDGQETVVNGKYGDLTIHGDGTWSYKANENNQFGRDNFQFRIEDADGDINDSEAGAGVLIGEKKPYEIDINVLPDNVDVEPDIIYEQELVFGAINLGVKVDGWTIVSATPQGHAGKMVKNADGSWNYVLDHALAHEGSVNIVDNVRLTLVNESGNTVTVEKRIDIVDDKPRLSIVDADIPIADGIFVREQDVADGKAWAALGGDGYEILGVLQNGEHGTAKLVDGQWIYELNGPMNSGNVQGSNVVKNADYITLQVKDENGFLRKLEVPVDIQDDAPSGNQQFILVHAPNIPGAKYSGNILEELLKDDGYKIDFGADGFGQLNITDDSRYQYSAVGKLKADNITGDFEFVMNQSSGNVISRYSAYNFGICDKDGDWTYYQLIFDHLDESLSPKEISGTDGDDLINPNPLWFSYGNVTPTIDAYHASEKNVIYGGLGDDIIFGEGNKIPLDMTEEQFHDYMLEYMKTKVDSQYILTSSGYLPNLVYGGQGNDYINAQSMGSVIFGDGDDKVGERIYEAFLDMTGLDSKFYDLAYDLFNKFSPEELEKISDKLELFEKDTDGDDHIYAGANSVVFGSGGNDYIIAGGNSIVFAGSGDNKVVSVSDGENYVFTGSGDDWIENFGGYSYSGNGNDILMTTRIATNEYINGGTGIDAIIGRYYNTYRFSNFLQNGQVENVEIMLVGDLKFWGSIFGTEDFSEKKEKFFGEGDRQIILNDDTNTITLGDGWYKLIGSETGKDYYRTQTYAYEEEDGNIIYLETTLGVTQGGETFDALQQGMVFSGHESEIPGRMLFDFGQDNGAGKKLSVVINGVEKLLEPSAENTVEGEFGTLTISKEGIFSYKAKPNNEGIDDFFFRIEDADGNIIDTDFNGDPIKVSVNVVKPEAPEEPTVWKGEGELVFGPVKIPFGLAGYKILEAKVDSDTAQIVQNADGTWHYVLTKAIDHEGKPSYRDTILMTVEDKFGNTYEIEKDIDIYDSMPSSGLINVNTTNLTEVTGTTKQEDSDFQWFYNFYADNEPGKTSFIFKDNEGNKYDVIEGQEMSIRGKYGTLFFTAENGNVTYNYKADRDEDSQDIFNFELIDSDGSVGTPGFVFNTKFSIDVLESDLRNNDVLSYDLNLPQHLQEYRLIEAEVNGHAGYTTVDEDGKWTYHLDKNLEHTLDNPYHYQEKDSFGHVTYEDENIIVDTVRLYYRDDNNRLQVYEKTVNIIDSQPEVADFTLNSENMTTIIGTTAVKDMPYFYDFGADNEETAKFYITDKDGVEWEISPETPMEIFGEYGKLSINASDGHLAYMYEAYDATNNTDSFNFRIVDSDGDERTSAFTVNTKFNENYDPDYVYDPTDIQPVADENLLENVSEGDDQIDQEEDALDTDDNDADKDKTSSEENGEADAALDQNQDETPDIADEQATDDIPADSENIPSESQDWEDEVDKQPDSAGASQEDTDDTQALASQIDADLDKKLDSIGDNQTDKNSASEIEALDNQKSDALGDKKLEDENDASTAKADADEENDFSLLDTQNDDMEKLFEASTTDYIASMTDDDFSSSENVFTEVFEAPLYNLEVATHELETING